MEEVTTAELTLKDFILKCYDLFGNKIKIKYSRTTTNKSTREVTVRDDNKEAALKITEWINEGLDRLDHKYQITLLAKEVQDARKEISPKV